jgi:hypothetical protein
VPNFKVTGPYFFKDEGGHADTKMLWNILTPEPSHCGNELECSLFCIKMKKGLKNQIKNVFLVICE